MMRRGPSPSPAQINGRSLLVRQAKIESQWKKGGVAVGGALQVKDLQSDLARGRVLVQVHQQQWYDQRERILQNGPKSWLLAQKASDVRLEKLEKVVSIMVRSPPLIHYQVISSTRSYMKNSMIST